MASKCVELMSWFLSKKTTVILYPWLDFDIKQLMLLGIRNVGQRPHQLAKKKVSQADQRGQFLMWWNNFWLCNKIFWGEIWDRNLVFSMLQLLLAEKRWWCADEFIFLYWKNVNFEGGAKRKQLNDAGKNSDDMSFEAFLWVNCCFAFCMTHRHVKLVNFSVTENNCVISLKITDD